MVKAIESARKAARQALESMYEGVCTVSVYKDETNNDSGLTGKSEVVILENQPCKLSFVKSDSVVQTETIATANQEIKLLLAPEIKAAEGSKIVVTQTGITSGYQASGPPAVYPTHQEIMLKLWKEMV